MPREYRHIKEYEKEIMELRKQGTTLNEIGVKLGLSKTITQFHYTLQQSPKEA